MHFYITIAQQNVQKVKWASTFLRNCLYIKNIIVIMVNFVIIIEIALAPSPTPDQIMFDSKRLTAVDQGSTHPFYLALLVFGLVDAQARQSSLSIALVFKALQQTPLEGQPASVGMDVCVQLGANHQTE